MTKTIHALFDGRVLHPEEPIELLPDTRVSITIETGSQSTTRSNSFLWKARSLNLQGPPDWSTNFEDYLYGGDLNSHE